MSLSLFAASSSGIGALGFDGTAFLIQLITFILAYLILRRYAFGPIIKALNHRRERIENSVKLEEQLRKEKAELDEKVEKTMHDSRLKADDIISSAHDTARQTVRDAEEQAKLKAAGIIKEAEAGIAQSTTRARQKLESELVGLISEVTEAVVGEKIDDKKDTELIEKTLKQKEAA